MRRVEESKKNEVEKSVNDETPTTPGKLSRMFEDSMRDSWPAPPTIHRGVEWSQFLNCSLLDCSLSANFLIFLLLILLFYSFVSSVIGPLPRRSTED